MKVIGIFNSVSGENIGLENLLYQLPHVDCGIIVVDQSTDDARAFIETEYPKALRVWIRSVKDEGFVGLLRDLFRCYGGRKVLFHVHHARAAVFGAVLSLVRGWHLFTTAHNNYRTYRLKHKVAFGIGFFMSDHIVCNSRATRASLPRFLRKSKVSVIYNGVDFRKIDEWLEKTSSVAADHGVVLGTACRMVPQKDLPTLIRGFAIAQAASECPLRLKLIGDGPERDRLEAVIDELGIRHSVEMTGLLSRGEVYKSLMQIDIFVVSSLWEGFCNAMVEAAAANCAIIASNVAPMPEVIGTDNAEFFQPGDVDELGAKILGLAADERKRHTLGRRAQRFVRARYDLELSTAQYRELYDIFESA